MRSDWTDVDGAVDYVLYGKADPDSDITFVLEELAENSTSGVDGLQLPTPAGTRFYSVTARNACAEGPH